MNCKKFYVLQLGIIGFLLLIRSYPVMSQQADTTKFCHTQCCMVDRTPVGIMISHVHPKKSLMFSYRFMTMGMNNKLSGTQKVSDDQIYVNYLMSPQQMRMDMHMLMAMYGLTDKITLMAMLNYNVLSMNMSMLPVASMSMMNMPGMDLGNTNMNMNMQTSGIGDTKLYALYDLYSKNSHQFLVSAGVSIPTGSIQNKGNQDNMYSGTRIPYNMQLGSGSYEILPGITWLKYTGSFSLSVQATSVIRTNYNTVGYKLGNEFTANVWAAYQWARWFSTSLRMDGTAIGKIQESDPYLYSGMEPAANSANYGGQRLNAYAGLNFYIRNKYLANSRLSIEYGIPVYQNLNGIQSVLTSTLFAGWQVEF